MWKIFSKFVAFSEYPNFKGSKILLVSMDKSNSDASSYEKYLSNGIESSIGAGGALVAGPIGYKVGKLAGKPLGFLTTGM